MVTLTITRRSGARLVDRSTAPVAAARATMTKKCQGCALSADEGSAGEGARDGASGVAAASSVKVAELIGESLFQGGIDGPAGCALSGEDRLLRARPADRHGGRDPEAE